MASKEEQSTPPKSDAGSSIMSTVDSFRIEGFKYASKFISLVFNWVARLLAWYTLYTMLFRCSTELTNSSPTICHAYGKLQHTVSPHLQPYYERYASPYAEKYGHYISHANEAYLHPIFQSASTGYQKYAHPHISKALMVAEKQYEENISPSFLKLKGQMKRTFDQHLEPCILQLNGQYRAMISSPVCKSVRGHYKATIRPAYAQIACYLEKGWKNGRYVVLTVVVPRTKNGLIKSYKWLDQTIWSKIHRFWQDYVELQIARISGFKFTSKTYGNLIRIVGNGSQDKKAARKAARKQVEQDLENVRRRLEAAAEEAIVDLQIEVDRLATSAIHYKRLVVEDQFKSLDKRIEDDIGALKAKIIDIAKSYESKGDGDAEKNEINAFDQLFQMTKHIGQGIKESVQNIRRDAQQFIAKVYDDVAAAADARAKAIDTLIDQGIKGLGEKWDWATVGVPHSGWTRYSDLRKEFSSIKRRILIAPQNNEKLKELVEWAEGDKWEGGAVIRAKALAIELERLKRVGKKKIKLQDFTEDFSDNYITKHTQNTAQKVLATGQPGVLNDAANTLPIPPVSAPSSVCESIGNPYTKISIGMASAGYIAEAREIEFEVEENIEEALADKLKGTVEKTLEKLKHASRAVSEALYGTQTTKPFGENISPIASEKYEAALSAASSALYPPTPVTDQIVNIATDKYSAAVEAASSIIYGTPTPWHQSAYDAYQAVVSSAADKYREAIHSAEAAISSEPQQAHESILPVAHEKYASAMYSAEQKYSQAIFAAEAAIYGTPQPQHESLLSAASDKLVAATSSAGNIYSQLSRRASAAILGTPPSFTESVASKAGEYAAKITNAADERIEKMQALVSEVLFGKEPDFTESVMKRFSDIMYNTVPVLAEQATGVAAQGYQSASSLVAKSIPTITPPPVLEEILHEGNQKMRSIIDAASVQVYGRTKSTIEKVTNVVSEAYQEASSKISEAIYGKEIGAFESAISKIVDTASSASKKISEAVYGTPTPKPWSIESVTSVVGERIESVSSVISEKVEEAGSAINENYEAAQSHISKAIYGQEYNEIITSAQKRLHDSVEKAKAKLEEVFGISKRRESYDDIAGRKAKEAGQSLKSAIEEVSKAVLDTSSSTTGKIDSVTEKAKEAYSSAKDEL